MTDEKTQDTEAPAPTGSYELALEVRIAELEAVVKTLAEHSRASTHGVVVAWLKKISAVFERGMVEGA